MNTIGVRRAVLWFAAIVGLVYCASISGSYHFDDGHSVQANLAIRSISNIPSFWSDSQTSSFIPENRVYRPLVYTFYSFCWAIGGGETWPFHLMKMAMHVFVCLALFLIWQMLWRLPGWYPINDLQVRLPLFSRPFTLDRSWAAFFLAILFAIHPAGSECVDYISATTSLQCALFYVWAFYWYLRYRAPVFDSASRPQSRYLWLSLLFYFLSVASKEEGITLPAMVIVTECFFVFSRSWQAPEASRFLDSCRNTFAQCWRHVLAFSFLGVVFAGWIYWMHPTEGNVSRGWITPFEYFITQWRAYLWYMRLWFWPWDLNADSATIEFSKTLRDPLVIQAALGNLIILAFGWFNRKRFPAFWFGLFWFYITISPASSVVVLAEAINEHRMYLAYIGFVGGAWTILLWLSQQGFQAPTRARRLGLLYLFACIGLVIGTQERNRVWANDENLWLDTIEKNKTSGRALNNLALVYMGQGKFEAAIERLVECERYWPTYAYCPLNKGISFLALKKVDEAEASLLRAYQLNPRNIHINYQLGRLYAEGRRDYDKALGYYQVASDLTGNRNPDADLGIASVLLQKKQNSEAKAIFERILRLDPNNVSALKAYAELQLKGENPRSAVELYLRLLRLQPGDVPIWYNYGVALLNSGDLEKAREAFERTLQLDPKSEQAWYNVAYLAERRKDYGTVAQALQHLIEIAPNNAEYQKRLIAADRLVQGDKRR